MTGILTRCSLSKCPMLFKDRWESSHAKDIHFFIKKSKFLRGPQSPFFQARKTNKSNSTGRRQRKRVTDVAGLLQLHLTQRVTGAPWTHCSLIPAQSSCPWSSKEAVSLLEGARDSEIWSCTSVCTPTPPLPRVSPQRSSLLSHAGPYLSTCRHWSLIGLQPFKNTLRLQDQVQIPHPGIPVARSGTHSPALAVSPGSNLLMLPLGT